MSRFLEEWEQTKVDMLMRHRVGYPCGPDLTRFAAEY